MLKGFDDRLWSASAGLRIAQDGRLLKGDFRGGAATSGASWTAGMPRLSVLGFGRPRAADVEREREREGA